MQFRNDIQGLRAIAVLLVLIFHISSKWLPGGFIGVDVFFVISGFLITKIITSKINKGTFSLKEFYISRVKRIVPAYYFLLISVAITFLFIFIMQDLGNFKLSYFWALIFNSHYYFSNIDDYFGFSSNENPLLHTWTLGVEMQFYIFLPLMLLLKNRKIVLALLIILLVSLLSYGSLEIYKGNKGLMYFSLLARTPEFLVGSLIAFLNIDQNNFIKNHRNLFSIVGVVGLLLSAYFITEQSFFPGIGSLPPLIFAGVLLCTNDSAVNNFLSRKIPVYIGELSYSIYLWHWPVIAFIRYYNAKYELSSGDIAMVLVVTSIGSLLSYYIIEKPLRSKNKMSFYIPFSFLIIANILLLYFLVPLKRSFSIAIPKEYGLPKEFIKSHGMTFEEVETLGDLSFNRKKILLMGDSHAHVMTPYLNILGKKHHFSMRVITSSNIPNFPDLKETEEFKNNVKFQKYKKDQQHIVRAEIDSADIIVVMVFGDGKRWKENLEYLAKMTNKKILFIKDYPHLNIHPVRINRGFIKNKSINYQYEIEKFEVPKSIKELQIIYPNFKVVTFKNENEFFKNAPFLNDTLIYYDQDHINEFASKRYGDFTGEEFMKYLNWALAK